MLKTIYNKKTDFSLPADECWLCRYGMRDRREPEGCPSPPYRVATVRENTRKMKFFSRSGKSQGILWMVREI